MTPLLALYIRDAYILTFKDASTVALYCGISLTFSLIAFAIFRIGDGMSHYFSVHHFMAVIKAVLTAELLTSAVLFSITRLQGIPRPTPAIHAAILALALVSARALVSLTNRSEPAKRPTKHDAVENILVIGMTRLSSLYIELLAACAGDQRRVIGVLDDRPELLGRSIATIPIVGPSQQLGPVVEEFENHGIQTHRVIIGGDETLLAEEAIEQIRQICARREITLDYIPNLIGLRPRKSETIETTEPVSFARPAVQPSSYYAVKRILHFFLALTIIILLLPLWIMVAGLVLVDVGMPVFFWQQRIGLNGRPFLLYKFRTMRPPFNWRGEPIAEDRRTSVIGYFLREMRLDELPQLLNVLVGDMDLIGPRPLLPRDQPADPTTRLLVRPGITGWAQVNGGTLLTAEEKDQLDEWYIRNASIWFDLRITFITLLVLSGRRRQSVHARTGTWPAHQNEHVHIDEPSEAIVAFNLEPAEAGDIKYRK